MWKLFFDGSVKNKIAYFGYILFKDDTEVDSGYGMIGRDIKAKNAEKYAMSYGLDAFVRRWDSPGPLKILGDCKQVIETAEKDPDLSPKIKTIRGWGVPVSLKWISRDRNTLANDLARKMIEDSRMANTLPESLKGNS